MQYKMSYTSHTYRPELAITLGQQATVRISDQNVLVVQKELYIVTHRR